MAYTALACIVMAYIVMTYRAIGHIVMAHIVMAYIALAYGAIGHIVMAHIGMAPYRSDGATSSRSTGPAAARGGGRGRRRRRAWRPARRGAKALDSTWPSRGGGRCSCAAAAARPGSSSRARCATRAPTTPRGTYIVVALYSYGPI